MKKTCKIKDSPQPVWTHSEVSPDNLETQLIEMLDEMAEQPAPDLCEDGLRRQAEKDTSRKRKH